MRKLLLVTSSFLALTIPKTASAETIKIGVLATLKGAFTVLGEDGVRGLEIALKEIGNKAGGKDIELIIQSTDASAEGAILGARKLVEEDKVDLVIGPLASAAGVAIKNYSQSKPQVTFLNGISSAQETTYVEPSENFFRFNTDAAQWSAGLGDYAFKNKGYKSVVTIGEDYSFAHTQVLGFTVEYCAAGGDIKDRHWVPLGTKDFSEVISDIPKDVDAVYLALSGGDATNFLKQYQKAGGSAKLIGGSTMVDGSLLNYKGEGRQALVGTLSSGPQADTWDNPKWQSFIKSYQTTFSSDQRFLSPSLLATGYYNATKAAGQCLNKINGNLADDHKALRACLSTLELDAPNGKISLDKNRQAIGNNFVTEIIETDDGKLVKQLVLIKENITQTLGINPKSFAKIGSPSRENPVCKASY